MTYGYARVSSAGQRLNGTSLEDQKERFIKMGIALENIYADAYSGMKMERPAFSELLSKLQEGDELVVCKLDRFARTAADGIKVVRELVDKGVRVNILNMGVADNTPMGKVMVTVMMAFAEFERDMIVERTQAGKTAKKASDPNYKEGRKAVEYDPDLFVELKSEVDSGKISTTKAAEMLHVSRAKWYRIVAESKVA